MTITAFTPNNLKGIRADLDAALKAVAAKHGITLKVGNIGYTDGTFKAKIEATCAANAGQKQATLTLYAGKHIDLSLVHEDSQGRRHRIVDFVPRRKAPWVTETQDGKRYQMTDLHARRWFNPAP